MIVLIAMLNYSKSLAKKKTCNAKGIGQKPVPFALPVGGKRREVK